MKKRPGLYVAAAISLTGLLAMMLLFSCNSGKSPAAQPGAGPADEQKQVIPQLPKNDSPVLKTEDVQENAVNSRNELAGTGNLTCNELNGTWSVLIEGSEDILNEQWEISCQAGNRLRIGFSDLNMVFRSANPAGGTLVDASAEFDFKDPFSKNGYQIQIGKRNGKIGGMARVKSARYGGDEKQYQFELRKK